jgi:cell division protein FtsI (penicillin-binding protein 3)
MTNPQFVVVVTLNGTHGEAGFGGQAAAPVFKIVAGEALRVFDVPKDLPENVTPTLVAKNPEDLNDLAIADLAPPPADMLEETDEAEAAPATPPVYGPHPVQTASAMPQGPPPAGAPVGAPAAPPAPPSRRGRACPISVA